MKLTLPNQLTVLRILLTPVFLYCYSQSDFHLRWIGTLIFVIASITDWYDGYIARKYGVITRFGQFMDPLADKILVLSAFFLFVHMKILNFWPVLIIAIRDIFVTVLRIYAIHNGMPIVTHIVAKWKTFLQMIYLFILLFSYNFISFLDIPQSYKKLYDEILNYILWVIAVITLYSLFIYFVENFNLITRFFKSLFFKWKI